MAAGGTEQAETHLRLLAEAELRRAPVFPGPGSQPHRVALAATALASADAIGLDTAWRVVADFQAACALRAGDPLPAVLSLRGIGRNGAWMLVKELFAWRRGFNRKQLGALVGLTPTPYTSSTSSREQGISKAGNKRLRRLLVELAWCWVRHQPRSALTVWFLCRFANGKRLRRIGIVAVARKLLIALWRYLERDEVPTGADLVDWRTKMGGKRPAAVSTPA